MYDLRTIYGEQRDHWTDIIFAAASYISLCNRNIFTNVKKKYNYCIIAKSCSTKYIYKKLQTIQVIFLV